MKLLVCKKFVVFIDGIRDDVFGDGGLTNTFEAMEEVRTNVLGSAGDR